MIRTSPVADCQRVLHFLRKGPSHALDIVAVCKLSARRWKVVKEILTNKGLIESRTGAGGRVYCLTAKLSQ